MPYQELINDFIALCRSIIGRQLTGIYLHGSMATGCFNPDKSDIDFIVVFENHITDEQKICLMKEIVNLNTKAPANGLEISFLKKEVCKPFVYPTPYELHFSPMHLQWFMNDSRDYVNKMKGVDKDLAAHITIMNHYGIKLWGMEIKDVFGIVPREDYIDSIWDDIKNATEDILDNPIYTILNLCRVSAYLCDDLILSKEKGGEWGVIHLDNRFHPIIRQAQYCYQTAQNMLADKTTLLHFSNYMLKKIKSELQ